MDSYVTCGLLSIFRHFFLKFQKNLPAKTPPLIERETAEKRRQRERLTVTQAGGTGDIPNGDINVERKGLIKHFKTTEDKEKGRKKM